MSASWHALLLTLAVGSGHLSPIISPRRLWQTQHQYLQPMPKLHKSGSSMHCIAAIFSLLRNCRGKMHLNSVASKLSVIVPSSRFSSHLAGDGTRQDTCPTIREHTQDDQLPVFCPYAGHHRYKKHVHFIGWQPKRRFNDLPKFVFLGCLIVVMTDSWHIYWKSRDTTILSGVDILKTFLQIYSVMPSTRATYIDQPKLGQECSYVSYIHFSHVECSSGWEWVSWLQFVIAIECLLWGRRNVMVL